MRIGGGYYGYKTEGEYLKSPLGAYEIADKKFAISVLIFAAAAALALGYIVYKLGQNAEGIENEQGGYENVVGEPQTTLPQGMASYVYTEPENTTP
jgi:hypothetical protein